MKSKTTLAIKLGSTAVGWTLISETPAPLKLRRRGTGRQTPVAAAIKLAEEARKRGVDQISLYRYRSQSAFDDSAAAREGMDWAEHSDLLIRVEHELRAAGFADIVFKDVP